MTESMTTLSYATPRSTPPAGATFTLLEQPDGVVLERPLPAQPAEQLALAVLGGMAVFGIGLIVLRVSLNKHWRDLEPTSALGMAVLGLFVACCVLVWPGTRARVQSLELVGADLFVTNGSRSLPNRRRRHARPRGFVCSMPGTDVVRLRLVSTLFVRTRFRWTSLLVSGLPRAECQWVANVLQTALDRSRASATAVVDSDV